MVVLFLGWSMALLAGLKVIFVSAVGGRWGSASIDTSFCYVRCGNSFIKVNQYNSYQAFKNHFLCQNSYNEKSTIRCCLLIIQFLTSKGR